MLCHEATARSSPIPLRPSTSPGSFFPGRTRIAILPSTFHCWSVLESFAPRFDPRCAAAGHDTPGRSRGNKAHVEAVRHSRTEQNKGIGAGRRSGTGRVMGAVREHRDEEGAHIVRPGTILNNKCCSSRGVVASTCQLALQSGCRLAYATLKMQCPVCLV